MHLINEVEKVIRVLEDSLAQGEKISAKKRSGFIFVLEQFDHLKLPESLTEFFNLICSKDEYKISKNELQQLVDAIELYEIEAPEDLKATVKAWPRLSPQSQGKRLKSNLRSLRLVRAPLHIKEWIKSLLYWLEPKGKSGYGESVKYFSRLPKNSSLTTFFISSGGLQKASKRVDLLTENVHTLPIEYEDIDFLIEMSDAISLIQKLIDSKTKSTDIREQFEFCVLCWRRVRPKLEEEFKDPISFRAKQSKKWASSSYCPVHHAKNNDGTFQSDRAALIRASKNEQNSDKRVRLDQILAMHDDLEKPSVLSLLLAAFSKPLPVVSRRDQLNLPWEEFLSALIGQIEIYYPFVYESIKDIDFNSTDSLGRLFAEILMRLDERKDKEEALYWRLVSVDDWIKESHGKNGRRVLAHMLRRYEAYNYVKSLKRPRGPKQKKTQPFSALQKRIVEELEQHIQIGRKPPVKEIAKKLNTSEKYVYKIKKKHQEL